MKKLTASILSAMLMLSMVFSSSVFAANDATTKASAWDSFVGLFTKATATTETANVQYRGHVQDYGDVPTNGTWVQEDNQLGTTGESKRIEGFKIELTDGNTLPAGTQIRYNVHVENEGWLHDKNDIVNTGSWEKDGAFAGSVAKSQRVEAIEIVLTDANGVKLEGYSVQYMVHVENLGWSQGWVADGAIAGTEGRSFRLEAIRIKITQTKADLTEYNAALAAVTQADYTTASWTTYQAVVNANKVTDANTQTQVNTATANITAAQANLVKVLKVESVSAINAREILVTFSGTVAKASAEATANYSFSAANSSAAALTVSTAVLQDDKKTVLLTLGTTLNNKAAASYLVNIKDVTDLEGKKTVEYSELKNFADTLAPTVTGITYPDSNTIKVGFSEPINTISTGIASATTIKLDGTAIVVPSSAYTLAADKKSFTINIATSGLVNSKNYEITIDGLADYATNAMTKFVGNITFAADTTNPKVVSLTAIDLGHLKVVFDEPMKTVGGAYFKVKVGLSTYDAGSIAHFNTTTPDYKTFVYTLSAPLAAAANKVVTIDTFQDVAGNPTNAATSTYTQEVAFAATKPAMTSTIGTVKTISGNAYIVFSFDRDVLYNTGNVTGTYLKDGVTYTATFTGATNIKDSTTLAGLEKNEIALVAPTTAGDYKVTFPAGLAKDTYSNLMAKTDATFVFSATATSATVTGTPSQGTTTSTIDYVTVNFSKDVGNDALTPSNYTVDGVQVFDSAIFEGAKTQVRLTLKADAIKTTGSKTFAVTGISNVTDKTFDGVGTNPAKIAFTENVKPVVSKVELVALDKVRVTFSEDVTNVNAADFVVKVNGTEVTPTVATGGSIVTLTLGTPLTSSTVPVTVEISAASDITDLTTKNLTPVGQLKTATVALTDTKGQADVALQAAVAQFDSNGAASDGALATGKTAATARTAYNAAVTAVNNHGDTTETVSINSLTPSYAETLAWLKGAVLMAEAEDFAATADLTISANYTTLFTDKLTEANTAVTAMPADTTLGGSDSAKTDIGTRATALFTTEKGLLDTAIAAVPGLSAISTAVTTNTAANLATASTNAATATAANTALTALTQATKTKLTTDTATEIAKITSAVANIKLAGTPGNPVVATWGSDDVALTVNATNLALTISPTTAATAQTIAISNTGVVSITGNPDAATAITISGTHAVFTGATVVTDATGSISTTSVITIS